MFLLLKIRWYSNVFFCNLMVKPRGDNKPYYPPSGEGYISPYCGAHDTGDVFNKSKSPNTQ